MATQVIVYFTPNEELDSEWDESGRTKTVSSYAYPKEDVHLTEWGVRVALEPGDAARGLAARHVVTIPWHRILRIDEHEVD